MPCPPRGNFPPAGSYKTINGIDRDTRFKATGEHRPPQKGEWYLSGAYVEAYLSPATLNYPYWIAQPIQMVPCRHCKGSGQVEA